MIEPILEKFPQRETGKISEADAQIIRVRVLQINCHDWRTIEDLEVIEPIKNKMIER